MSSTPLRWLPNSFLLSREVAGEFVIYDPNRDAVHTLNPTARVVWEYSGQPVQTIAEALCSQFRVSLDTALCDVERVLEEFKAQGLLQQYPPQ